MEKGKTETLKKDTKVIFLIGNGYDLYNGLKTGYNDFLLYYLSESIVRAINKNGNYEDHCIKINLQRWFLDTPSSHSLIKIKELLEYKIKTDSLVYEKEKHYKKDSSDFIQNLANGILISCQNNFIKSILTKCFNSGWEGIEMTLYNEYRKLYSEISLRPSWKDFKSHDSEYYIDYTKDIININKSNNCLKNELLTYILNLGNPKFSTSVLTDPNVISWCWNKDSYHSALFLNFNYTSYLEKHLNLGKLSHSLQSESQFINIHGDFTSEMDEIVFGIGDEQEDFLKDIESYFGNEWLEPLKSFFYLKNDKYQDLLGFIEKGDYEIYVVGHSCSITDRTLLKMLFENEYCKKIHVMHHKGMDSYLKTAYNISRNFDNKIKLRKVLQPFDPKLVLNRSK